MEDITSTNIITFNPGPSVVGWYCVDRIRFAMSKKPNFIHRFFVRIFLGWKWEDENNDKENDTRRIID